MVKRILGKGKERSLSLFLLPTFLLLLAVSIFPVLFSFTLSLCDFKLTHRLADLRFVGLDQYIRLFSETQFWSALRVSFLFVIGAVALETCAGLFLALLTSQPTRGIGIFRVIFTLPMIVAPIVTGLIWKFLFDSEVGGVIQILRIFGIQHFNLLNNVSTALWGIIIADAWQWTPFVFLVITAGLQNLPLEVYEAAKVDGARGVRMFFYIILPQLRFVILVAVLFRSIDLFKFFDKIYIMTGGGPSSVTTTLGYYVYKQGFMFFNGSFAAASAFVLLFVAIVTCQAMIRLMSKVK